MWPPILFGTLTVQVPGFSTVVVSYDCRFEEEGGFPLSYHLAAHHLVSRTPMTNGFKQMLRCVCVGFLERVSSSLAGKLADLTEKIDAALHKGIVVGRCC